MPTPLHSPHLPALYSKRQANIVGSCCFCCEDRHLWPFVLRPVPDGASAGCVCLQCLFCGLCACLPFCLPCLLLSTSCPRSSFASSCFAPIHFASPLFHCHVRQDRRFRASSLLSGPAVCKLRELSRWQLQHGPAVAARAPVHLTVSFFLQSP